VNSQQFLCHVLSYEGTLTNEHAAETTKVIASVVLRMQSRFVSPRVSAKDTGGARGQHTQEPRL